ncbi:MAG TPA: polysaccharide biosynthesis/export family protein [Kofleriaceae bacterium]|jgi:polysaccharide export outer membrane protein|nr:polysaccharide biosynthesis/export family protein [Kofleriaceae bacterium]
MRHLLLVVLAATLVACDGCGGAPPARYPNTQALEEVDAPLGPGDAFDLTIYYGANEHKSSYRLTPTGKIAVQYIGDVTAAGKTVQELQDEIRSKLADGYLRDPVVNISLTEANSTKISVFGQVQKAGTMRFQSGMSIVDAIAQSGGFTPMAKKNEVQVTRVEKGRKVTYTVPVQAIGEGDRPNFSLQAGDVIFVPERWY